MPLYVSSKFQSTVVIDGEIIPIKIKRFGPSEATEFTRSFARLGDRSSKQSLLSDEPSEQREAREYQEEVEAKKFVVEALSAFIEVEPGYLYLDGQEITKGEDLAWTFGARDEVLTELLVLISMENKLNAEQKLNWRIRLAPFVRTPEKVAERMMEVADVGPSDVVYDLGCGDGRLSIAAAKRGAKVMGFDVDADRVKEARDKAAEAGVADLCVFVQKDAMTVNVKPATVVVLYLLAGANAKLRPVLLNQLQDRARVVSHAFTMKDWLPEREEFVELGEGEMLDHANQRWVYLYSVAAWRRSHGVGKGDLDRTLSLVS